MTTDYISDNQLKYYLQKYIRNNHIPDLTNLKLCGSRVISQVGTTPAVFVIKNDTTSEAKFFGTASCHSAWACPSCTAKVMAKKATEIACAIDALETWYNQKAFMITFTIPHSSTMSCRDTFNILLTAWRKFTRGGNKGTRTDTYTLKLDKDQKNHHGGKAVGKKGETRQYTKITSIYGLFREQLKIKHNIRVFEFTWGENSWHQHIHALFWVPKENFNKVLTYEQTLYNRWWHCCKEASLKYWNSKLPEREKQNKKANDEFYANWRKYPKTGHRSLFISKDEKGHLKQAKSSEYIAGWGGDKETTAQLKKGRKGHLTPLQILQESYQSEDPTQKKFYMELFIEYAKTTKGHMRTYFSARSGIKEIIKKWQDTKTYKERVKKKFTQAGIWKTLLWFTKKQWSEIWNNSILYNKDLTSHILKLARAPNAKENIQKLLLQYKIDISKNKDTKNIKRTIEIIENKIFANKILKPEETGSGFTC